MFLRAWLLTGRVGSARATAAQASDYVLQHREQTLEPYHD